MWEGESGYHTHLAFRSSPYQSVFQLPKEPRISSSDLKHDHSHMCSRRGRSSWQTMQGRAPQDENADLDLDATGGASVAH